MKNSGARTKNMENRNKHSVRPHVTARSALIVESRRLDVALGIRCNAKTHQIELRRGTARHRDEETCRHGTGRHNQKQPLPGMSSGDRPSTVTSSIQRATIHKPAARSMSTNFHPTSRVWRLERLPTPPILPASGVSRIQLPPTRN